MMGHQERKEREKIIDEQPSRLRQYAWNDKYESLHLRFDLLSLNVF